MSDAWRGCQNMLKMNVFDVLFTSKQLPAVLLALR